MAPEPGATARATGTRTRPTRQATRRRILDAAMIVFGERGIATSSLSEVAAEAGLTKGAVYSSFDSKDALVLAMMEEHAMHRLTAGLDSVAESTAPQHMMTNVARVLVHEMHADAAWHRLLAEYFAMSHRDARLHEALRDRRREAREAVSRALSTVCRQRGLTLPMPVEEFSVLLFALSNGLAVEAGIDPDAVPDDLLGRVLDLLAPVAGARLTPR